MGKNIFRGVGTALITPFRVINETNQINWPAFQALVEMQVFNKINFLVPCGTTGESPTLTFEEHCALIKATVEFAGKNVPVLAGTGSNNTTEAVELAKAAKEAGAAGVLAVSPYYNKPTQAGILDY
jgi:4-hydroxy-tetrahydrodipicolinate synthase